MTLQLLLDQKNITKYHLSKISGVPKTTIIDICSGQSSIDRCSAKTVLKIAKTLGCSMEYIMMIEEQKSTMPKLVCLKITAIWSADYQNI